MNFNSVTAAAQDFSENTGVFGEAFTYSNVTLVGVFNQVMLEFRFDEFSTRKITGLACVTSKPQWVTANIAPADRGVLTYGNINYQVERIDGANTAAEPAYTLTLKRLT